jgi:aminoglycoside phosphotransferase (APT) family kinase protein
MTSILPDQDKIEEYLGQKFEAENLKITSVWKNLEGWSMETFSIGIKYNKDGKETEQDIILRKEPVSGLLEPYDASIEYRVLSALSKTEVAIPKTFWYEPDPEVMGLPFYVMEKVEGIVHFIKMTFDPNYRLIPDEEERESLADGFVKNISLIHNADWKELGLDFLGDPGAGTGSALKQVEYWEEVINRAGFGKKPVVTYTLNYLKDNLVENDKVTLVHGDYRTGNFIAKDKKIVSVLDWEMVHLGDPMEDISYIIGTAWRSARPHLLVSHLISKDDFFKRYEDESGIKIDKDKLKFYHILINFKSIGIAATAANAFKTKTNKDLKPGVFGNTLHVQFFNMMRALNKYLSV